MTLRYDRTYNLFIDDAIIATGTTTEPSKWGQGDKQWFVSRDITHLQALLMPSWQKSQSAEMAKAETLPAGFRKGKVLFLLGNGLTQIYNVPVWAKAEVHLSFQPKAANAPMSLHKQREAESIGGPKAAARSLPDSEATFQPSDVVPLLWETTEGRRLKEKRQQADNDPHIDPARGMAFISGRGDG